jgi:hypothetical protein
MSKQTINIGASPNDGTGTPLRTSFDYTNQNFTELYTALGGGVGLPGATTQVIFNDGGTNLAGDAGLVYNKTTDALTVAGLVTAGSAAITGALTVDTTTLVANAAGYTDKVGIGTATPSAPLNVRLDNAGPTTLALFENGIVDFASSAAGQIVVGARGYNNTVLRQNPDIGTSPTIGGPLDTILANTYVGVGSGKLILATQSTARLTVHESSGDVSIVSGNVVMATSGKGIDFSAVTGGTGTATANVLNDYEEGTFTPTVVGTTADGTIGTYYANTGRYTKVGRLVTVQVYLAYGGGAGATGDLAFAGLPFAIGNIGNNYASSAIGYFSDIALTASNFPLLYASPNSTRFLLVQSPVGGGAVNAVPYDNNGAIMFTATYLTA